MLKYSSKSVTRARAKFHRLAFWRTWKELDLHYFWTFFLCAAILRGRAMSSDETHVSVIISCPLAFNEPWTENAFARAFIVFDFLVRIQSNWNLVSSRSTKIPDFESHEFESSFEDWNGLFQTFLQLVF